MAAATATAVVAVLGAAQPLTAVTLPMPCYVVAWGDNFFGQTDVRPGLGGVTATPASPYHDLALVVSAHAISFSGPPSGRVGETLTASATASSALPVSSSIDPTSAGA